MMQPNVYIFQCSIFVNFNVLGCFMIKLALKFLH